MKKILVFAILALFMASCQESLEDRCAREAKEYTAKNCPARMDTNIIMDSLTFEKESHTLHYYYRLTGIADKEGALDSIDAKKLLKDMLKNTTSMRVYKDNGYSFAYTYHSEKDPKKVLLDVVFTEKDYQ